MCSGYPTWGVVFYGLLIFFALLSNVLCFARYREYDSAGFSRTLVFFGYVLVFLVELYALYRLLNRDRFLRASPRELTVFAVAAAFHFGLQQVNSLFAGAGWFEQRALFEHYQEYAAEPIGVLQLQVDAVFLCLAVGHAAIGVADANHTASLSGA